MQQYRSHKIVEAAEIVDIQFAGDMLTDSAELVTAEGEVITVSAQYMVKHDPKVGGYYVRYPGGYESWSPRLAFKEGYSRYTKPPHDPNEVQHGPAA